MTRIPVHQAITRTFALTGAAVAFAFISSVGNAAQVWKLDFGSTESTGTVGGETWNTITQPIGITNTGQLLDLMDTTGAITDVDFLMLARFSGENTLGTMASTLYPVSATRDSLYGNTETFEGRTNIFPRFKIASLDPGLPYDLTFYASRTGVTDNRETLYTVTGQTLNMATLNVANNVDNSVSVFGVYPNAFGEIEVALTEGPANTNSNSFTYLGVMTMSVPEPATSMTLGAAALLLAARRRRLS